MTIRLDNIAPLTAPAHTVWDEYNPREDNRLLLATIQAIIDQERARDLQMTVRAVHYNLVKMNYPGYPNTPKSYKRLVKLMSDARYGGWLALDCVVDRGRALHGDLGFTSVDQFMGSWPYWYDRSHWPGQDRFVEVWVEKETMLGIVEKACQPTDTHFMATRGFISVTALNRARRRITNRYRKGQPTTILHLSDHDASGLDMFRAIGHRLLTTFQVPELAIERVALTMDQIRQFSLPSNPAKESDSRAKGYIERYGRESWELEALDSDDLVAILQAQIAPFVDSGVVADVRADVARHSEMFRQFGATWDDWLANR